MSYVLGAVAMLIWIGMLFGSVILIINTTDGYSYTVFKQPLHNYLLAVFGLIICIASLLWIVSQPDDKPCVRYETSYQYNAATKTMMPMRYCAQQGEWVK